MTDASQRPATPPAAGTPAKPAKPAKKRSVTPGQIVAGILFVLIVVFIVENTENVKIRIIAGPKVNAPVFVALLIAAVVGALISALLQYRRKRKSK